MPVSRLESLRIKAKLLQKAKARAGTPVALKEAYGILARTAGFTSWQDMKATLELHELLRPAQASALWSVWYGSHEEALAHLQSHGGYLLPYQQQFFICDTDYIRALGLQGDEPELARVGRDWARPLDTAAFTRLLGRIKARGVRA